MKNGLGFLLGIVVTSSNADLEIVEILGIDRVFSHRNLPTFQQYRSILGQSFYNLQKVNEFV